MLCHPDVDGAPHADEKAGEQGHQNGGRSDRPQRLRTGEFSDNRHVRHIEQHLQQLREHQRNAEKEHIFPQGAVGHLNFSPLASGSGSLICHKNSSEH